MKKIFANSYYFILGVLLILLSILLCKQVSFFWTRVFQVLGLFSFFSGAKSTICLFLAKNKQWLMSILYFFILGTFLFFFPHLPLHLFLLVFSLYVGGLGVIKLITYFQWKKSKIKLSIFLLLTALILIFVSVTLFIGNQLTIKSTSVFLGAYSFGLGMMYLLDWIKLILPLDKKNKMKRHIRISPPIWFTALIPRILLERLSDNTSSSTQEITAEALTGIQILIHVTPDGFGAIGHCDVVIDGLVYSYGNYDDLSATLFESLGDGVLVMANIEEYIPFCIANNNKTIFLYTLQLSKQQENTIRKISNELRTTTEPWLPKDYVLPHKEGYAQKLTQQIHASLFKFKQGKFKNYFVLGCNCVDLVDQMIGPAGIDFIGINGIVSPGAYQIYLEKEYQFKHGLVSTRRIYCPENT